MVLQFPAIFTSRIEMLRQILADAEEKKVLAEEIERKDTVIQQNLMRTKFHDLERNFILKSVKESQKLNN